MPGLNILTKTSLCTNMQVLTTYSLLFKPDISLSLCCRSHESNIVDRIFHVVYCVD